MTDTTVPGLKAVHTIITPTCRQGRGIGPAFDEAVRRLRAEYELCQNASNAQSSFHLLLTVERPERRPKEAEGIRALRRAREWKDLADEMNFDDFKEDVFAYDERQKEAWAKLWLRQRNFGKPLQPILPTLDAPFVEGT